MTHRDEGDPDAVGGPGGARGPGERRGTGASSAAGSGHPHVLCVGLSCIDFIWQVERFPPAGSRTHATSFRQQGGGPAATAAVTVARLGGSAELWAVHGDDMAGRAARDELRAFGVDVAHVRHLEGAQTFASAVLVEPSGERWIFPHRGEGLIDEPAAYPLERAAQADAVLADYRHPELCMAAIAAARDAGVPTVADVSNAATWERAGGAAFLIASEECAHEVAGTSDVEAALAVLRHDSDQWIGITLGAEGFLYADSGGIRHVPALPVAVADTTGAGDVFHGAWAYGAARGWDAERSSLFASVAAAVSCTGIGRERIPTAADVERLLETRTLREMNELKWT